MISAIEKSLQKHKYDFGKTTKELQKIYGKKIIKSELMLKKHWASIEKKKTKKEYEKLN